jgi:hypothetical protein
LKALLENYFKPSINFLKISLQACLQNEKSYKGFYKAFFAKGLSERYISKTIL